VRSVIRYKQMLRFLLFRKLRALVLNLEDSKKWFSHSKHLLQQILNIKDFVPTDVLVTHETVFDYDFSILQQILVEIQSKNLNELAVYLPDIYCENERNIHRGIKNHIHLNLTSLVIHSFNKSTAAQILSIRSVKLAKVSFSFKFEDHDFYQEFYFSLAQFLTHHSTVLQSISLKCSCEIPFKSVFQNPTLDNFFFCKLKSVQFVLQNFQFSCLERMCCKILQSHVLIDAKLSHSLLDFMMNQLICVNAQKIVVVLPKQILGLRFFAKILNLYKRHDSINFDQPCED